MSLSRLNGQQNRRQRAALLAYTVLTAIMTWPLVMNLTTAIPGDSFDGWQNYWNQWWIKVALVERAQSPLTTDLLYAPTGVGLYFHTLNPFNGLTTLPVQLSMGLIAAYNAVVFVSWVLGGYGVFLLTQWVLGETGDGRRETGLTIHDSFFPPFFAGLVYTFAPFHMAHLLGHMQVMSLEWIPFYILYLLRGLDAIRTNRPWPRAALMAALFLTLTGLCDWYFVLYLFFFTMLALVWTWLRLPLRRGGAANGPTPKPHPLISTLQPLALLSVTGGIFLLLLSPMLIPMIREATQFSFMVRPATDLYILSASLSDFLIPNRLHTLFQPESFGWIGNQIAPVSERTIAIGYVPLLLTGIAIIATRRRVGLWVVMALFFLLMALGPLPHLGNITMEDIPAATAVGDTPSGWSLFTLLNRTIPFMRISRSVSRYALMVQLAVAVMSGVGLAWLLRAGAMERKSERDGGQVPLYLSAPPLLRSSAPLLLCALLLFEYWVAPFPMSPPDTPAFYSTLRDLPGDGSVLNLPMNYDRPGYLLYQTVHQKPLTIAYISRDDPRTLAERAPVLQHFRHLGPDVLDIDPVQVGLTVLHDLQIDYVVLDRYKMPGGVERDYTTGLAEAIFVGQAPLYEDERLTVYQLQTPNESQPYLLLGPLHWGPLENRADGSRRRPLLAGPAALTLHHINAAQPPPLRIRYHTAPGVSLTLRATPDGAAVTTLEPAPNGQETTVNLAPFITANAASATLFFYANASHQVWIESVGLK